MKMARYISLEVVAVNCWVRNILINFLPDLWIINNSIRPAIARLCGMKCGKRVVLQKGIFYGNPKNVYLGDKSVICRGSFLDGFDKIVIGKNVAIAFGATMITSTHEMGTRDQRTGKLFGSPVVIGDGVWVGAQVTIAPGVEIGAGSIISAGAAVMYSAPPNSLIAGVPAKVVSQLEHEPEAVPSQEPVAEQAVPVVQAAITETAAKAPAEARDGEMTKLQFYSELEFLLELKPGSLKGTESLGDLPWNSMTILAFIATADSALHEMVSPSTLAGCQTVSDLVDLFPNKIL
jgi:maltose O-acetyltransferase